MILYTISPLFLCNNKVGFELGMDTYLRVRSLGAMNDIERKRRIVSDWTELCDNIIDQDKSVNTSASIFSDEEEEEGEDVNDEDSDGDTHYDSALNESQNLDEGEEEEEEEEGEGEEGEGEEGEEEEGEEEEEEEDN